MRAVPRLAETIAFPDLHIQSDLCLVCIHRFTCLVNGPMPGKQTRYTSPSFEEGIASLLLRRQWKQKAWNTQGAAVGGMAATDAKQGGLEEQALKPVLNRDQQHGNSGSFMTASCAAPVPHALLLAEKHGKESVAREAMGSKFHVASR